MDEPRLGTAIGTALAVATPRASSADRRNRRQEDCLSTDAGSTGEPQTASLASYASLRA